MPISARIRPLIAARWRDWLPLAVLIIALASVFALGGDRGYFYPSREFHNEISAKNLAIAENISPKHGFRLTPRIWRDEDGGFEYALYGRFPVGGYALIKLAILPFEGDLAAKLLSARVLMLLMFCGAAIFAYLALARIAVDRWIALAAVLLSFSSLYALYFADSVAGETAMDMFGVTLVFHGMVVFIQEGRFRQLLIKTCAALLLGWHVYALIMPFALWGFGGEAFALIRSALAGGGGVRAAARAAFPALARSRFIALAAAAILFGCALLAINFANEYAAYGGSRSLRDLPSVDSMTMRLGLTDSHKLGPGWTPGDFSMRQLHRAGVASAPYAAAGFPDYDAPLMGPSPPSPAWAAWGFAAAVAALAAALALVPRRFRLPMACLVLMGFCWALAARGSAYSGIHSLEGMFFVGLPLALWVGALIGARRLLGARLGGALAIGIAALAAPIFALSTLQAARVGTDEYAAKHMKEVMADMDAIREIASEKDVVLSSDAWNGTNYYGFSGRLAEYYLAGSYLWEGAGLDLRGEDALWTRVWRDTPPRATARGYRGVAGSEYAVSRRRDERLSLTPGNRHLFLYAGADLAELYATERRRLESSEPSAAGAFGVYLEEGALLYLKSPCAPGDADAAFFAHFFPPDAAYLRGEGDPIGFDGVNFPFSDAGGESDNFSIRFADACMTTVNIPYRPIAAIRTGQYISDRPGVSNRGAETWQAAIFPPPSAETLAAYENAYQTVADGEPAAQSGFDLHLNENNTISYLKQPCSEEDARGRFFLSVHPADADDLPAERRALGHESLNFDFEPPRAVIFNGKCMATIQLPDYEIAKLETGQDAADVGRLWDAEIAVSD